MGIEVGKLCVRRCTLIAASPKRVWEEFESFEKLNAWFGIGHKLEKFKPGNSGIISMSVELEGKVRPYGGNIVVWEPESELSIEDNWYDEDMAWSQAIFITFRLSNYENGT